MASLMMTIKAVLISCGVASVGLLLKDSVPVAVDFSVSRAPILWSYLESWLKPPYLYVVTNGIILIIVASSKFYRSSGRHDWDDDYEIQTEPIVYEAPPDSHFGLVVGDPTSTELESEVVTAVVFEDEDAKVEDEFEIEEELKSVIMVENSDQVDSGSLSPDSNWNLPPTKPLVFSGNRRRKSAKTNPEGGRASRVTEPMLNETLEDTWKMITQGKSTPLTKQLYRRCETFTRGDSGEAKPVPVYKKSETFRDRTNYMKREPSLSQEELNQRAEEFIKKFNKEMKLQRMESLRQNMKVTRRGV